MDENCELEKGSQKNIYVYNILHIYNGYNVFNMIKV